MDRRSILLDIYKKMESDYDGFLDGLRKYVEKKLKGKRKEKGRGREKEVKTHQLRRIYAMTRSAGNLRDIKAIRFQLAYLAGREAIPKDVYNDMDELIKNLRKEEDVGKFKEFMEALLAYHKFYEKQEGR